MRLRPFIGADEAPRPFSEVLAERSVTDPARRVLEDVAELEAEAEASADPNERRQLQGRAEALRCAIAESRRTR